MNQTKVLRATGPVSEACLGTLVGGASVRPHVPVANPVRDERAAA